MTPRRREALVRARLVFGSLFGFLVTGSLAAGCEALLSTSSLKERGADGATDSPTPPVDASPFPTDGPSDAGGESAASATIAVSPASHDFGAVPFGTTSPQFTLTVSNTSGVVAGTLSATLSGTNQSDFAISANDCPPSLGPDASCSVSVTTTPHAVSAESASLDVTSTGAVQSAQLTVTGDYAYSDLADMTKWSTFDVSTKNASAKGFNGTVFDGRYIYLVPFDNGNGSNGDGVIARYDTQAPFAASASWSTFDISTVSSAAVAFSGGAFDGRYLYLAPTTGSLAARYDTRAPFAVTGSWSTADPGSGSMGFSGAVFDGRFIYYVPDQDGLVTTYDTLQPFSPGWPAVNLKTVVNANAGSFVGGVFDGRYLYLAPNTYSTLVRYDTQGFLTSAVSWSAFDISTVNANVRSLNTAAFDGRYIYFAPSYNGLVVRCDTQAAFGSGAAWTVFNAATISGRAGGYISTAFDGRYVYFVPDSAGTIAGLSGLLLRYDTRGSFISTNAWGTFDMSTLNPNAVGFGGAAFDGRYVYMVQLNAPGDAGAVAGGTVARFDAKQPPLLPKLCQSAPALNCDPGSFF
jgi:hypothetical protein